jgi:glycosyltransferase involved in cell wall biosynthesis
MINSYKYKFSIFTPCYNSARFINRVFETLDSQTYRNFEWIVINDASTDNTSDLIIEYIKNVDFHVKFFDLKINQMLAANYNLALSVAEGEIFFPHGHDDTFIPTVLEEYVNLLSKFDASNISGIVARCVTQFGDVPSPLFDKDLMNYWEYAHQNGHYVGEMPDCIKTEIFKRYTPFDVSKMKMPIPVERIIGCDGYKSICYNKIVRTYYVKENETSLSKIGSVDVSGNFERSLLEVNLFQYHYLDRKMVSSLKVIALYIYYSKKNDVHFWKSIKLIHHKRDRFFYILLYPIVILYINNNKDFFKHCFISIPNLFVSSI